MKLRVNRIVILIKIVVCVAYTSVLFAQTPDYISFPTGFLTLYPGEQKTLGSFSLRFTDNADLQVFNNRTATVAWRAGTRSADCGTRRCSATFQTDGNLVIVAHGNPIWASNTWGNYGAALIFQPKAAHLTIRNGTYDVIWKTSGAAAPGVLDYTLGPRAVPVQRFRNSIGVSSHMSQYERDAQVLMSKLSYLGIHLVRDGYPSDNSLISNFRYLADRGIRFNLPSDSSDIATRIREANTVAALRPGALESVEGPNEINNFPFSCNGSTWQAGWPDNNGPAARCFMTKYYSALNSETTLNNVLMYNLTGNLSALNADRYGLLSLNGHADRGNIHVYPGGQPYRVLLAATGATYFRVLPRQTVITEIGYTTLGPNAVSQRAQALMTLNVLFSAFKIGYPKTFLYDLSDTDFEGYGLFDTSGEPKKVADVIHNLTTIIADNGSPISNPGVLGESVSGMPRNGYKLLMQKSDGKFLLILWNEATVWNGRDISVAETTVQINLGARRSQVKVFNPYRGTSAIQNRRDVSSVTLQMADEPLIIEVRP